MLFDKLGTSQRKGKPVRKIIEKKGRNAHKKSVTEVVIQIQKT